MSCLGYVAFQLGTPELLMESFFGRLGPDAPLRGRDVVAAVRPCWEFAREAAVRGGGAKKKTEQGAMPSADGRFTLLWHGAAGVCHALVCQRSCNADLGLNFLQVFASVLADHAKGGALETFQVKPDEALVLLDKFLPSGQLLVLSNNLIRHLKKEADAVIIQKA